MMKKLIVLLSLAMILLIAGCATTASGEITPIAPAEAEAAPAEVAAEVPAGVEFIAGAAPVVAVPESVGIITDNAGDPINALSQDQKDAISAAFVEAYRTAMLAEGEFKGGTGDKVHHWGGLEGDAGLYAQNFEGNVPNDNTWGIPGFIMIAMPVNGSRAFIVKDQFIAKYSMGDGFEKNNGPAGYGAPLTDEYVQDGLVYQLFEKGLMIADGDAVDFVPGAAPAVTIPDSVGIVTDDAGNPLAGQSAERRGQVSQAFRTAYVQGMLTDAAFKGGTGDKVHHWGGLEGDKGIFAQNFEGTRDNGNTWGIPGFIMISQAFDGSRAFIVKDQFIEKYSMGDGFEKNNGPAGYGAALTDQYVKDGTLRQLFEKGLMIGTL